MKRILFVLLFVPTLASAAVYQTPSGVRVETDHQMWVEKIFVLPSGLVWKELIPLNTLKYLAQGIIPIAHASTFTLRDEIEIWLKSYAEQFEVDIESFRKLAWCESGLEPTAFNPKDPHGGAYGIFQWLEPSWNYYNKKFKTSLDRKNWKHQIEMSARVLSTKNGWQNWINCTKDKNIKWK